MGLGLAEVMKALLLLGARPLFKESRDLVEYGTPHLVKFSVIHAAGLGFEGACFYLFWGSEAGLFEFGDGDEIWVAGVGGEALIGAIPVAGGTEGKHLPDRLVVGFTEL